jgi:hypothetical protein
MGDEGRVSRYIPCPVCGGEMFVRDWPYLQGDGTGVFIDCEQRHRSQTPPNVYEPLRLAAVIKDAEDTATRLREASSDTSDGTSPALLPGDQR